MHNIHQKIHELKKSNAVDPIVAAIRGISEEAELLCIDEFQVKLTRI